MSDLQKFKENIKKLSSIGNPGAAVVDKITSLKNKMKEERSRNPNPKKAPKMMNIEETRIEKRNKGMKNLKERRFNKTDVPEKPILKPKKPFQMEKRMEEFRKERKLRPGERKQIRTENMAKGGRAGFKSGSKGCKLAKRGKGRAYGKNS